MSRWFKRTDLNMILNLDKLTEDRIVKALDSIHEEQNIEQIQNEIFEKIKSLYEIDSTGVIYDVTNTYLYGKNCTFGQLGKDKEGVKGRPLIQIGLGVTKKDGIPIFHKAFNGNISDSRTLHDLITSFGKYKIKSGIIIYDRGITSGSNIKQIKKLGWNTICGLASNNILKEIARKIISENKLIDIKKRIKLNTTIFYVFQQEYEIEGTRVILLVCYNEQKADIRESRYDEIKNAQELKKSGEQIKAGLEKYFYSNGSINHKLICQDEEFDGFSFVFSTKKIHVNEIMRLYFKDKDIIEQAFQSLKDIVKLRPIRHWLYNRVRSHIFICYLSYLLLSLLKLSLKKINMSPIRALRELDSLYKVYIKDKKKGFELSRTVALTKVQEKILKTIDKELLSKCSG
jgi:transposase